MKYCVKMLETHSSAVISNSAHTHTRVIAEVAKGRPLRLVKKTEGSAGVPGSPQRINDVAKEGEGSRAGMVRELLLSKKCWQMLISKSTPTWVSPRQVFEIRQCYGTQLIEKGYCII